MTVELEAQKEAKLAALAREKGVTPETLVREAIDGLIAAAPEPGPRKPTKSLRGIHKGVSLSAEEIDEARREFWGYPKREETF